MFQEGFAMTTLSFKSVALAITAVALSGAAIAAPKCSQPKEKWMPEATFKSQLEQQGYKIKTFKVSGGQCYEIYGFDKAGKKVEIYFDPVTAAVLESK
jgi:hypothetical protein